MKKMFCLVLIVIAISVSLVACTPKKTEKVDALATSQETIKTTAVETAAKPELSGGEVIEKIINAKDADEVKKYLLEDDYDYAENILTEFNGSDFVVETQNVGSYEGYDLFKIKYSNERLGIRDNGVIFLKKVNGRYYVTIKSLAHDKFYSEKGCRHCNATGTVKIGESVCGICAGSGWQHIPNAYYDETLKMWMSQEVACSGCGGSGQAGMITTVCPVCNGDKFIF